MSLPGPTRQDPMHPLPPDYHSHTRLCGHATGEPADYHRHAVAFGLPEMATTDHVPFENDYAPTISMDPSEYPLYESWVKQIEEDSCRHLLGIEADYFEGCENYLSKWLSERPLDVVLGSVHFLDFWNIEDPARRGLFESEDPLPVWKRYFELIGQMADTGLYDIASHLDLPKKYGRKIDPECIREWVLPALDRLAAADMALEINTSGALHKCREFYPAPEILSWACERGIPLSFGSDAHDPSRIGDGFEAALVLARSAGYTESVRFRQRKRILVPLPEN